MLFIIAAKLKARIELKLKKENFPSEENIQLQLIKIRNFYSKMRETLEKIEVKVTLSELNIKDFKFCHMKPEVK
jgi:hypothetical protein